MRSGTDLCRGQRRLDSRRSKNDGLCLSAGFVLFTLAEKMLSFCLNLERLLVLNMESTTSIVLFIMGSPRRHKEVFALVFFSWRLSEVFPCLIINYSSWLD